ncbi:MAG: site-specific integrase [Oscillospiraceae bacterium]|nr:site-specific integrase [Oscillospiraceae bacterium]
MPAYKDDKRGSWYCSFHYTDWTGANKRKVKRGFAKKKDAETFEREFLAKEQESVDMTFEGLVEIYLKDMNARLKGSTMETKENIINKHVLPHFRKLSINEIKSSHIRKWQTFLMDSESDFSQTYLKSIHNQMSAIMNYAVKHYNLRQNPCKAAGSIGARNAEEMNIWTYDTFTKFIEVVDKPAMNLAFKILFWSGIRIGEMVALEPADILPSKQLDINKTLSRVKGETLETSPKTYKSSRIVAIPDFLYDDIMAYINSLYKIEPHDKIFYFTRTTLNKALDAYASIAGIERIRVHDLRHSHASMLIEMKQPILLISERLGHESVQTTWDTYAHLYPDKGIQLADALQEVNRAGSLTPTVEKTAAEKQADLLALVAELAPELQSAISEKLSVYSAGNEREETIDSTTLQQFKKCME